MHISHLEGSRSTYCLNSLCQKRQTQTKALLSSQVSGSWSSSACPLSPVSSHGDNSKTKYLCLERRQVLHRTYHETKHKPCQHTTSADLKPRAVFPPAVAQDHATALCHPTSPTSLSREYACVPDHDLQKAATHPDVSIKKSLRHSRSAGTVPSLQIMGNSALQSGRALPTATLRRGSLRALLLLAPHNEITGTRPKRSIRVLGTQGGRELLIAASDMNQQNPLQQMTFCILSICGKNPVCHCCPSLRASPLSPSKHSRVLKAMGSTDQKADWKQKRNGSRSLFHLRRK